MLARLFKTISRFRSEERGNVLIMTAFAVPAISIVAMGSLDSWQMMEQHRRMTVAGEQAAIAALRPERIHWNKRKQLAERMFLVNTQSGNKLTDTRLKVRAWKSKDQHFVEVTAKANYKSIFGPVAGGEKKPLKTITTAAKRGNVTRVVNAKNYGHGKIATN